MNATLHSVSQPVSPLLFAASEANLKSGSEMKHRWIEQVLEGFQRTNELMGQGQGNEMDGVARSARKSSV